MTPEERRDYLAGLIAYHERELLVRPWEACGWRAEHERAASALRSTLSLLDRAREVLAEFDPLIADWVKDAEETLCGLDWKREVADMKAAHGRFRALLADPGPAPKEGL